MSEGGNAQKADESVRLPSEAEGIAQVKREELLAELRRLNAMFIELRPQVSDKR